MKKITLKGRKIISNILKGFSLTTAMFIFQSCYGVPQSYINAFVTGNVTSKSNKQGIKGIKVSKVHRYYTDTAEMVYRNIDSYTITDNKGFFSFYADIEEHRMGAAIVFEDIDSSENGLYERKIVEIKAADKINIDVTLNEIQQDSTSLQ